MIQLGRLTKFTTNEGDEITYVKMFPLAYESLAELFEKVDEDLKPITSDRTNIFYTVAHHLKGKRKFDTWQAQDIIPFDFDGIDLNRIDEYAPLACKVLGIDIDKCGEVHSGNGVHLLVQVKMWNDTTFIKSARLGYRQLMDRLEEAFKAEGLPLDKDTTAWDYGRILRCPFTVNKKIKEVDGVLTESIKQATLKRGNIELQQLDVPVLEKPNSDFALTKGSFPMPDGDYIKSECEFFKWLEASPEEVHEPHAYAMLSVAGHFPDDFKTAKDLWDNFSSPSINSKNFSEFAEQALTASGPRTCEGINDVWGNCRTCKHFTDITSPIMLKGPDFIGTEHCGFTLIGPKGGRMRQYEDLRRFYDKKTNYIHLTEIKRLMVYKEGIFVKTNEQEIKGYSQKHFEPLVQKDEERKEFLNQVKASPTNHRAVDFIHGARNEGLINLANGVFNLNTMQLSEHSPEHGFLYKLPYDYNPNADCPTWLQLLKNLTLDRPDLINLIEESIAYTIGNVPYTKYQHPFFQMLQNLHQLPYWLIYLLA